MFDGVIFDVDGTLVDSVDLHARAWQRTLAAHGFDLPFDRIRSQIGKGGDQLMPALLPEAVVAQHGEAIEAERGRLFKAEYLSQVKGFPGVEALFRHILSRGQRIALGSSGKPEEVDHYKRLLGIEGMDLAQTTSADAERSKPHPDIFEAALRALGLPAASVAAIGDSPYDATAARRAGIVPFGVRCGGFKDEELIEAGAETLFGGPADLLARYAESPLAR